MADIAMLVAEEYERRVNNSRKFGAAAVGEEEIKIFSYFSALAQKVQGSSSRIKMRIGEVKINDVMIQNRVFEPQNEISLAAINAVFSA
ncbi:hypothetical protein A4A49_09742 [Nicotiana attenuata]|uniref:Uncharacterized protein n=1 Tax=Nicotiana attenuata TaxID=49451 RepID=A0A1J6IFE1_NICAT|nr:hypothetical protein A4A49_09742 [Nicotiana attenuata]